MVRNCRYPQQHILRSVDANVNKRCDVPPVATPYSTLPVILDIGSNGGRRAEVDLRWLRDYVSHMPDVTTRLKAEQIDLLLLVNWDDIVIV